MLLHTFSHIPGIGPKTEQKLWAAGVTSWRQWKEPIPIRISANTAIEAANILAGSRRALEDDDPTFFTDRLKGHEAWRIFNDFRHRTAYLDIETTGLEDFSEVTTIALYDGCQVKTYVNGQNLDDFVDDIERYKVIISYNGKSFDVPFLERYFRTKLRHAQIDLRYVLARLGFKGGLKGCEKQLGISRGDLDGVDGYFAVLLWDQYHKTGNERFLNTLLAYNIEDTINLERLAVEAYNRNVMSTPFASTLILDDPPPVHNPYSPDIEVVSVLKDGYGYY